MNIKNHPQAFRFTKENARQMAAKSWQARRERKAKLEAEARKGRQSTPQSERLALQIERIECMMEQTKDADTLQKLSATHARLFNAWQVLTETPNPGSRRLRPQRQQRPAPSGSWLDIKPLPVAANIPDPEPFPDAQDQPASGLSERTYTAAASASPTTPVEQPKPATKPAPEIRPFGFAPL